MYGMEHFSWRMLTTLKAQKSNLYGILPYDVMHILLYFITNISFFKKNVPTPASILFIFILSEH